jgi:hypothetical protein
VNVNGQPIFPVAEVLRDRRIPFLFSTGYGASGVSGEYSGYHVLNKPFSEEELQHKMVLALGA